MKLTKQDIEEGFSSWKPKMNFGVPVHNCIYCDTTRLPRIGLPKEECSCMKLEIIKPKIIKLSTQKSSIRIY